MNRILFISLFLGIAITGITSFATAEQLEKKEKFSILFSNNVSGEYEPCG